MKNKRKLKGRPPRHGGYSIVHRDELIKRHPKLRQYLQDSRDGLVRDVAGSEENLSEQQRICIDRIISRLSLCRLIEIYVETYGVFRRDRIKRDKVFELEPVMMQYLSFSNSIDKALIALKLEKRHEPEHELSPDELAEVIEADVARMTREGTLPGRGKP